MQLTNAEKTTLSIANVYVLATICKKSVDLTIFIRLQMAFDCCLFHLHRNNNTDVFTKTEHILVPLLDRSAPFMEDIVDTKEGLTKLLKGLNPSKALGPDEFHPRVLKELATELGPVFAHLFQQSIDKGEIPKVWSLANICPLFKKGDRSLACNYRPVYLTCVPCKFLEHRVCSNIMAHLDEHRLFSEKNSIHSGNGIVVNLSLSR